MKNKTGINFLAEDKRGNARKMKLWLLSSLGVILLYGFFIYIEAMFFGGSMRTANISALAGLPLIIFAFIITFKFPQAVRAPMYLAILTQLTFIVVGSYLQELNFYFFITFLMTCCVSVMKDFKQLAACVGLMALINVLTFVFFFIHLNWLPYFRFFMQFVIFLYGSIFLLLITYNVVLKESRSDRALVSFSALLRGTPNYVVITNSKCQIRYLSDSMAKFIQCPRKEFAVGQPFVDLVSNRNLKIMFADILDSDGFFETVMKFNIEDEEKYFKIISDKLSDEVGGRFIDISDVTDMVKSQQAAEEALEKAESANATKSKFLATMSHEIRTPMNAIIGITEIEMGNEEHSKETKDSLLKIYNSGHTLLHIINDILDFSKIETGKFEIVPIKYDIASLINDTVQLNMMRMGSKRIEFALRVSEDLPTYLIGDELRIKQVLNNLLSNAFKYTDNGQVTLEFKAEREPNSENIRLIAVVSDTGQGMSEAQVAKLFDEFSRFNLESNRTIEGTGLGMSITKKLVELMQGGIAVESEIGKGSVFTVDFLQQIGENEAIGKELAENLQSFSSSGENQMKRVQITQEYMPYGSVLIVDDIETNLFVAKGLLRPYGLKIETAASGFKAIDKIRGGAAYDIIFMDHMMPQMDGIETTRRLREAGYAQPIVALTANAISGQAEIFLENGFDGFVSKPIDIRQLNAALNKFIRDKQTPEVLEAARQKKAAQESVSEKPLPDASLLAIFAKDAKKALLNIESIFKNADEASKEDLRLFTTNAHAMKSALASIGEHDVSRQAALLEKAGKAQNISAMQEDAEKFINALKDIVAKIDAQNSSAAEQDEDPAYLSEQLQIISKACADYDDQNAGAALANLQKMRWAKETKAVIDQIAEHLLFSDFEAAGAKASQPSP